MSEIRGEGHPLRALTRGIEGEDVVVFVGRSVDDYLVLLRALRGEGKFPSTYHWMGKRVHIITSEDIHGSE